MKVLLATAAVAAVSLVPAASAERVKSSAVPKKIVHIGDNFFTPDTLRVKPGTYIVWRWPSIPGDVHDVYLARRPAGVKRFHSALAASDFSFRRKLTKVGRYRMICTIHEGMSMGVRVRR
jgi:plastocyanin